jgi:hypothetical protein
MRCTAFPQRTRLTDLDQGIQQRSNFRWRQKVLADCKAVLFDFVAKCISGEHVLILLTNGCYDDPIPGSGRIVGYSEVFNFDNNPRRCCSTGYFPMAGNATSARRSTIRYSGQSCWHALESRGQFSSSLFGNRTSASYHSSFPMTVYHRPAIKLGARNV